MAQVFDVLVVGGGISGVSLAARLAERMKVALAEAEGHLGTHATGRSAALLVEAYGPPAIRLLTGLSRSFFETPPDGFADSGLSRRRGAMIYAGEDELDRLGEDFELAGVTAKVTWLQADQVLRHCALLKPNVAAAGFLEPDALDLDTNALLHGFARAAQRAGTVFFKDAPVRHIGRTAQGWNVVAGDAEIACGILVDAAGAWADDMASLAGVARRNLQPMRRTAATLKVPDELVPIVTAMPFVAPVDDSFYFKPDAGAIMVSLSEETPSEPCDAYPDDFDVALALERFHAATSVPRTRPAATWAGLRTFAPDRNPVVGFDTKMPDFFWCAGQGGYGIETSPALSLLAAKLLLNEPLTDEEATLAHTLRPGRIPA
jgi:D-arginine dehydrogenase